MFHIEQSAEDVSSKGGRVALGGLFSHRTRLALGAGVVDGDINAIEARGGFVDEVADIVIVKKLDTPELRINPFCAQLNEKCLACFFAAAGEGDTRAFFRQGQGGRSSNAVSAGDQNDGVLIVNS